MKAQTPIPKNIRIVDREAFLAGVEKRGHVLLRAKTENPNNHLLVIYSDTADKYAVVTEVGPNADFTDLRHAARETPPGLALRYIVPCAQCPPYVIPKGLAQTSLPHTLAALAAPPPGFGDEAAGEPESEDEAPVAESPPPAVSTSPRIGRPPLATPPPARLSRLPFPDTRPTSHAESAPPAGPAESAPAIPSTGAVAAAAGAAGEPGTLAALLARSLQDIEKGLAERDSDLRRREVALASREGDIAAREREVESERRRIDEEAARINADFEAREAGLHRREAELHSRLEVFVRNMRDLEELRRKVESLFGKDSSRGSEL